MGLSSGTQLGSYEIVSSLGSGGMGEVYRARDSRIGRDVAIKVLPTSFVADSERLRRFEQETRAAGSLNHPNILSIYDVGTHQGCPFLVSELLEGETLRNRLQSGALTPRRAAEYALQIAHGLAAAHERGIVHRDLKPENIFITKDGRVKILDFGLAKLTDSQLSGSQLTRASTVAPETESGVILGTVVYMSPEQVRGERVDHRSDLFAFGGILYEMVSGKRPFQGDSSIEVMHAILKEEPLDLVSLNLNVSPSLERIVRRCLEKRPDQRFQSASDLAFALEALTDEGISSIRTRRLAAEKRTPVRILLLGFAALAIALIAFFAGKFFELRQTPTRTTKNIKSNAPFTLHQLTFRRGIILNAKFSSDGQTIIYDAAWGGNRAEIFFTRLGNPESRSLGLKNVRLLSVSRTGQMAILLSDDTPTGTMAEVSFTGGAPRPIAENVHDADWSPDGKNLVIVRGPSGLEYPIGKQLYKSGHPLLSPRFSPKGDRIAFIEMHQGGLGTINVIDLSGRVEPLWQADMSRSNLLPRLAWAPSGEEIWFAAKSKAGNGWTISAVSLSKQVRQILPMDGVLRINDISPDGRILVSHGAQTGSMIYYSSGKNEGRDLSWLDNSTVADISHDGKTILFTETGEGSGASERTVYLRNVEAEDSIRLGDGWGVALSPDGKWALTFTPNSLNLVPTGVGEPRTIRRGEHVGWGYWLPDSKRILFEDAETGHARRLYLFDLDTGAVQPASGEGIGLEGWGVQNAVSPDGKHVIAKSTQGNVIYSLEDSKSIPIKGLTETDSIIRWNQDGHSIYVDSGNIYRVDLVTGRRQLWKELRPADRAGIHGTIPMLTADGRTVVSSYLRILTNLYLMEGL